jgi:hypothetical protein
MALDFELDLELEKSGHGSWSDLGAGTGKSTRGGD